jgi:DNA-binding SARP family transcriptional activator
MELAMAHGVHAWAMAHLYGSAAAASDRDSALAVESPVWRLQVAAELADVEGFYGDPLVALADLEHEIAAPLPPSVSRPLAGTRARAALRLGRLDEARRMLAELQEGGATTLPGFESSVRSTMALLAVMARDASAPEVADAAIRLGTKQGAGLWLGLARVARAFAEGPDAAAWRPSVLLRDPAYLSMAAEVVASRLDWFSEDELGLLAAEVRSRGARWRPVLRRALGETSPAVVVRAAQLLDQVGESGDVALLRATAKKFRRVPGTGALGRSLARRIAHRVMVEDLGRVRVVVGARQVASSLIRRKVLALICFLLTQRELSATRDQVLDALWPEQDPGQALNSLNQTLYFLRRVIEPAYDDDLTPGYVYHSAELVWLDSELVTSRSARCRERVRAMALEPSPDEVSGLLDDYRGRFALDFEYEEWATAYRDWLHKSFLEVVERSIKLDTRVGQYGRAIRTAQRTLEADPDAEQIELSLVRLYRLTGAHLAAAEQYAHYSALLRNTLGVDAPPLETI